MLQISKTQEDFFTHFCSKQFWVKKARPPAGRPSCLERGQDVRKRESYFPFYAGELTTMVVRLRDGEKLFNPHRRHLYQLLANELKIAHWKVSLGYGILQLVVGLSVLTLRAFGIWVVLCLLAAYLCGFIWLSYFVRLRITRA